MLIIVSIKKRKESAIVVHPWGLALSESVELSGGFDEIKDEDPTTFPNKFGVQRYIKYLQGESLWVLNGKEKSGKNPL